MHDARPLEYAAVDDRSNQTATCAPHRLGAIAVGGMMLVKDAITWAQFLVGWAASADSRSIRARQRLDRSRAASRRATASDPRRRDGDRPGARGRLADPTRAIASTIIFTAVQVMYVAGVIGHIPNTLPIDYLVRALFIFEQAAPSIVLALLTFGDRKSRCHDHGSD